jgi:hypothetical protein
VCQGDGTCVDLVAGTSCGPCGICDGSGTCAPSPGNVCGLCKMCDSAGGCTAMPADDTACGTIDCDGLDTVCRDFHDLTSNRCAAPGVCKTANSSAACDVYTDAPLGTQCLAPFCDGTVLYRAHQCGTGALGGQCTEGGTQDCTPYGCSGGACRTSCATGADCAPTAYCDGGVCRLRGVNGALCTDGAECQSGFCVDDVCCNTACSGLCASCGIAGSVGTCSPVPAGTDPDGECTGAGTCGGTCNGVGACVAAGPGDPCGTCRVCSGSNECVPVADGTSCEDVFYCVTGETCQSGVCAGGAPIDCDDANPCTADACSEHGKACLHASVEDGTACDGDPPCGAACHAGACGGGASCDDGDPCTDDRCEDGVCAHDLLPACQQDAGQTHDGAPIDGSVDGASPGGDGRGCSCAAGSTGRSLSGGWLLALLLVLPPLRLRRR